MIDKHTQGSQRQQQQQNLKQNHLQFLKKAVTAKPISLKSEWEGGGGRGEGGEFFLYESAFKYYRTVDGLLGEIVPLVEQYWFVVGGGDVVVVVVVMLLFWWLVVVCILNYYYFLQGPV